MDHPAVIREVRRILGEHAENDLHASDRWGGSSMCAGARPPTPSRRYATS
jgi:hypothetical protein